MVQFTMLVESTRKPVHIIAFSLLFLLFGLVSIIISNYYVATNNYMLNTEAPGMHLLPEYLNSATGFQLGIHFFAVVGMIVLSSLVSRLKYSSLWLGAVGASLNLLDRLGYNGVVDYWVLGNLWFNLNDVYIVVGGTIWILQLLISEKSPATKMVLAKD